MPKASADAAHLEEAAAKGLGYNDPKMITLRRVGAAGAASSSGAR
jgi:hypothetical protein